MSQLIIGIIGILEFMRLSLLPDCWMNYIFWDL